LSIATLRTTAKTLIRRIEKRRVICKQIKPLEGKINEENKNNSVIPEEKEIKMEHPTATYWG